MTSAALLALAFAALPARAATSEAVRTRGADAFRAAPGLFSAPPAGGASEPLLQPPLAPKPFAPRGPRGKQVARVGLAAQLDKQRALLARQLGTQPWDIGGAADAGLKTYYLTFTPAGRPAPVALAPLGDLNRLRGEGVNARVDAQTVYNFKVIANIFNPARGSTLSIKPVSGTRGPGHDVKTGVVLDAVKARSSVFKAGGKEFWLHYGTDVKADGTGFAESRSFLFIHENGLSSKAWPLAESALKPDVEGVVELGDVRLRLTRTSGGEFLISEAR